MTNAKNKSGTDFDLNALVESALQPIYSEVLSLILRREGLENLLRPGLSLYRKQPEEEVLAAQSDAVKVKNLCKMAFIEMLLKVFSDKTALDLLAQDLVKRKFRKINEKRVATRAALDSAIEDILRREVAMKHKFTAKEIIKALELKRVIVDKGELYEDVSASSIRKKDTLVSRFSALRKKLNNM